MQNQLKLISSKHMYNIRYDMPKFEKETNIKKKISPKHMIRLNMAKFLKLKNIKIRLFLKFQQKKLNSD